MAFLAPLVGVLLSTAGVAATTAAWIGAGLSLAVGFIQSNKKQKQPERQAQVAQLSLGEGPREAIFGKAMTGGRLMQAWNDGTKNEFETMVIKIADHECNDLEGFLIGEAYYGFSASGAQSSFNVGGTDHLWVYWQSGAPGQTVPGAITAVSGSEWPSTATMTGCAHVIVRYRFNEKVWPGGRPQFKWYMGGAKLYDPRKDSTVPGGSGSHRWGDESTYEYTQNPIICAFNYRRGIWNNGQLVVGRGLNVARTPGESVIADANICDEPVEQLTGPDLVRYDCGRVTRADEAFIDVMQDFADCCAGLLVQRSGRLEIAAGAPQSSVFSFADEGLTDEPRDFLGWLTEGDRCNTVVPRYLEPTQFWNSTSAPTRRDSADVTADGRPFETVLELDTIFVNSQAQRVAEVFRRKARLERTAVVTLPPRACNVEAGDVVTWTSNRYLAGDTVKFRVMRDEDAPSCRKRLTLREYADSIYDWDAATDEIAPGEVAPSTTAPGALALASPAVTAVRVSGVPALQFTWTGTTDPAIARIIVEVRVDGDTEAATTTIADPSVGLENVFNGVVPATAMELRARPDSDNKSRETTWTSWLSVTTLTADYAGGGFFTALASDIINTPAGSIAATDVQAALNELDSEKQPLDGDLSAFAALTPSNDDVLQRKSGAWANRTLAQLLADLSPAWTSYTPTLAALSGSITTPGTVSGLYLQIGKLVVVKLFGAITTNGTAATGITFTLPVLPLASSIPYVGAGRGSTGYMLQILAANVAGNGIATVVDFANGYPGGDASNFYGVVTYEAA